MSPDILTARRVTVWEAWAAAVRGWIDRSRFAAPLLVYGAFAAIVFMLHGPEPPLSIDHVSYFKLAEDIRLEFTRGDYWRSFNAVRGYGVLLAYLYDYTGSHLLSLKLLLAAMTVAYLWAFQGFMSLVTPSRARAMLFALFSALFVTFGASIWGMTDFSASLNRTIIVPFVVLLAWFFFRKLDSPWRYAVLPALIALSMLHLSALHVFLVFGAFEIFDWALRRRLRLDRDIAAFFAGILAALVLQGVIEKMGSGTGGFVRNTIAMAVPSLAEMFKAKVQDEATVKQLQVNRPRGSAIAIAPKALEGGARAAGGGGVGASVSASIVVEPVMFDAPPEVEPTDKRLSNREAWRIELLAFPWRNFPPSLATVATIASSFGLIFLLAAWGAIRSFRSTRWTPLDKGMVAFAFGTVLAAFGLQATLWLLRDRTSLFPINFEEIRAINMLMVPAVYFIYRLYESAPTVGRLPQRAVRVAIMVLVALQPIVLVRALPAQWREGLIDTAVTHGFLRTSDAPRMLYARQFLGLADEGRRFYYSSRPVLAWLERNIGRKERVLTNLNDIYGTQIEAVGPFLLIVTLDVWDPRRMDWSKVVDQIDVAMMARDLDRVLSIGRSLNASYAIVDWPVADAIYRDEFFSVVRVPRRLATQ